MFSYFHPVERMKREQSAWKETGVSAQFFKELVGSFRLKSTLR